MTRSILCPVFPQNEKISRRSGVYKLLAEDFIITIIPDHKTLSRGGGGNNFEF